VVDEGEEEQSRGTGRGLSACTISSIELTWVNSTVVVVATFERRRGRYCTGGGIGAVSGSSCWSVGSSIF
jgi:hypothetical protein